MAREESRPPSRRRDQTSVVRRGFSLIELVIVVGLVMVLLGLALPQLRASRREARSVACLATMRSLETAITAYAHDAGDHWPYGLREGFIDPFNGRKVFLHSPYVPFGYGPWVHGRWTLPMADEYFRGSLLSPELFCSEPNTRADWLREHPTGPPFPVSSDRGLSTSLFLSPAALDPEKPEWAPTHFRVTRLDEAHHPSNKAALPDTPLHDSRVRRSGKGLSVRTAPPWRMPVIPVDLAGATRDQAVSIPAVVFPYPREGANDEVRRTIAASETFNHTPFGVHGRDW